MIESWEKTICHPRGEGCECEQRVFTPLKLVFAAHPDASEGQGHLSDAQGRWYPRWEQPRIKFSDGRSAAHRAAEPHGDADRLFTAPSVL